MTDRRWRRVAILTAFLVLLYFAVSGAISSHQNGDSIHNLSKSAKNLSKSTERLTQEVTLLEHNQTVNESVIRTLREVIQEQNEELLKLCGARCVVEVPPGGFTVLTPQQRPSPTPGPTPAPQPTPLPSAPPTHGPSPSPSASPPGLLPKVLDPVCRHTPMILC